MRDLSPNPSVPPIWFEMGLGGGLATDPSVLPAAFLRKRLTVPQRKTTIGANGIMMAGKRRRLWEWRESQNYSTSETTQLHDLGKASTAILQSVPNCILKTCTSRLQPTQNRKARTIKGISWKTSRGPGGFLRRNAPAADLQAAREGQGDSYP